MRFLYITTSAGFDGGAEQHEYRSAQLLRSLGYEVDIAWQCHGREAADFFKAFNHQYTIEAALASNETYDAVFIHKLLSYSTMEAILAKYPHVALFVHDHRLYCPMRTYQAGRRHDTPCSRKYSKFHCAMCLIKNIGHGAFKESPFKYFPKRLELCKNIPLVFVQSQYMRDNLLRNGFHPRQIQVLHPFIPESELPKNARVDDGKIRLLFIGRLIPQKGADLLIEMMQDLPENVLADIVGDGPEMPELRLLIEKYELNDRVKLCGWRQNVMDICAAHDILVLPYRYQEPFGIVGLEAAACGLPIVAFDLGGCREFLTNGRNGFLIPPGNTLAFEDSLNNLIAERSLRATQGNEGRIMTQKFFSPRGFIEQFQHALGKLLNRNDHDK